MTHDYSYLIHDAQSIAIEKQIHRTTHFFNWSSIGYPYFKVYFTHERQQPFSFSGRLPIKLLNPSKRHMLPRIIIYLDEWNKLNKREQQFAITQRIAQYWITFGNGIPNDYINTIITLMGYLYGMPVYLASPPIGIAATLFYCISIQLNHAQYGQKRSIQADALAQKILGMTDEEIIALYTRYIGSDKKSTESDSAQSTNWLDLLSCEPPAEIHIKNIRERSIDKKEHALEVPISANRTYIGRE